MTDDDSPPSEFDDAAEQAVALGNRLLNDKPETDAREIADGLLAGIVHFWFYAYQPCGDPYCESCADIATAEQRVRKLLEDARISAEESDYYHSPHDTNVGSA